MRCCGGGCTCPAAAAVFCGRLSAWANDHGGTRVPPGDGVADRRITFTADATTRVYIYVIWCSNGSGECLREIDLIFSLTTAGYTQGRWWIGWSREGTEPPGIPERPGLSYRKTFLNALGGPEPAKVFAGPAGYGRGGYCETCSFCKRHIWTPQVPLEPLSTDVVIEKTYACWFVRVTIYGLYTAMVSCESARGEWRNNQLGSPWTRLDWVSRAVCPDVRGVLRNFPREWLITFLQ